jgi:chromosome partitioning protein
MYPKMSVTDAAQILKLENQSVIKRLKSNNLNFEKSKNRVYFGHKTAKALFNSCNNSSFTKKCMVIATQIVKGGTGKTALTLNLAVRFSLLGKKVAIIDLDQQSNLTAHCDIDADNLPIMIDIIEGESEIAKSMIEVCEGLHLLPSRIDNAVLDDTILFKSLPLDKVYKKQIDLLKPYYDVIFIDCPPALGRSVGAVALSSDLILCPVSPDKQCLTGLKLLDDGLYELEKRNLGPKTNYKIIFNKYDGRTNASRKILSILFETPHYREHMLKTYIRLNQEFVNYCIKSTSIYDSLQPSSAKDDIDCLAQELIDIFPQLQLQTSEFDLKEKVPCDADS